MKNRKGFTLIELLTVIAILAVIMLIATPIILGVLDKARRNTYKNQLLLYVEALKQQSALVLMGPGYSKLQEVDSNFYTPTNSTAGSIVRVSVESLNQVMDNPTLTSDDDKFFYVEYTANGYNYYIGEGISNNSYTTTCEYATGSQACIEKLYSGDTVSLIKSDVLALVHIGADESGSTSSTPIVEYEHVGDPVTLGEYNWHVIGEDSTKVWLWMDAGQVDDDGMMSHCTAAEDSSNNCTFDGQYFFTYSWNDSAIRAYLNGDFYNSLPANVKSKIVKTKVCKDPSSNGGPSGGYTDTEITALSATCGDGSASAYVEDKVRLITPSEYYSLSPVYAESSESSYANVSYITRLSSNDWMNPGESWTTGGYFYGNGSDVERARYIASDGKMYSAWANYGYYVRPVIVIKK